MGTRRNTAIATQNPVGLAAPLKKETFWRKVHRHDAWLRQGRRCKYCCDRLEASEVTADHKLARKHGGQTSSRNISAACRMCNVAKGHMPEASFNQAIRRPQPHHRWTIRVSHWRRRVVVRGLEAERRILQFVGLA